MKNGEKLNKVGKSGVSWEKCLKVGKSCGRWGKSGEKWGKVEKKVV